MPPRHDRSAAAKLSTTRRTDDCPRIAQEQPVPGDRGAGGFLCKAKPLLLQIRAMEMSDKSEHEPIDWKTHGVKVLPGDQLDPNTAQTAGMDRAAAINLARVGAQKIWAGTVKIRANAKTGAHRHGHLESVIYVLKGRARMRWGDHLEYVAEAGPGDFIFVPPYVPHQEINASTEETLECALVRSDNEAVVVNLDIEPVERPEEVRWIDPIHRHG
jgi:uncharacterized RmlC-like cupin family protein